MKCFFFSDTATTEISPLSLHDALPICSSRQRSRPGTTSAGSRRLTAPRVQVVREWNGPRPGAHRERASGGEDEGPSFRDRKSTRLNSSHANISYAVFCLIKIIILHPIV